MWCGLAFSATEHVQNRNRKVWFCQPTVQRVPFFIVSCVGILCFLLPNLGTKKHWKQTIFPAIFSPEQFFAGVRRKAGKIYRRLISVRFYRESAAYGIGHAVIPVQLCGCGAVLECFTRLGLKETNREGAPWRRINGTMAFSVRRQSVTYCGF